MTRLTVFAASSLTDVFKDLEIEFESQNREIDVVIATAGSQILRFQIEQGAKPDIFASANKQHMSSLVEAGFVHDSEIFAHNRLIIVMPEDNPAKIATLNELPEAKRIVLGTPAVPIGQYTQRLLNQANNVIDPKFRAKVLKKTVSRESNVRQILAKAELGEADAAFVYTTDIRPNRKVQTLQIPEALNPVSNYHIGILARSEQPLYAQKWMKYVTSKHGKRVLKNHGFELN